MHDYHNKSCQEQEKRHNFYLIQEMGIYTHPSIHCFYFRLCQNDCIHHNSVKYTYMEITSGSF